MKVFISKHIQYRLLLPILRASEKFGILDKYKIELVEKPKHADLILYLINSQKNLLNINFFQKMLLKNAKVPVIILENLDSAISWFREFDKVPTLKAIIKNQIL